MFRFEGKFPDSVLINQLKYRDYLSSATKVGEVFKLKRAFGLDHKGLFREHWGQRQHSIGADEKRHTTRIIKQSQ